MNTLDPPPVFDRLATLGDTTRSRLLALLEDHELAVGELCQILQMPQSTVSRHLRILADAGWVASRAEGTTRYYRMEPGLPADAGSLWALVRGDMQGAAFRVQDRERTRSVLDRRRDRSRAFFSASADRWDRVRDDLYGVRADLLPLFGLLDPDQVVADLGAGTGSLARMMAPFVARVVAVDRSREMLDAARERLADLENVEIREGELETLPLADGEADLAILSLVLHYVLEPATVLAEAARILRPGGRLVVVEMRAHDRVEYREEMGHLWQGFGRDDMKTWLEEAGLGRVVVRPLPPDPEATGPLLFLVTAGKAVPEAAAPGSMAAQEEQTRHGA